METKTENLRDYLYENFTTRDFSELPTRLNISETKLTRLLNNTDKWDAATFKKLVAEIKEFSPLVLLQHFELKNNITVNEMDEIIKEYEQQY